MARTRRTPHYGAVSAKHLSPIEHRAFELRALLQEPYAFRYNPAQKKLIEGYAEKIERCGVDPPHHSCGLEKLCPRCAQKRAREIEAECAALFRDESELAGFSFGIAVPNLSSPELAGSYEDVAFAFKGAWYSREWRKSFRWGYRVLAVNWSDKSRSWVIGYRVLVSARTPDLAEKHHLLSFELSKRLKAPLKFFQQAEGGSSFPSLGRATDFLVEDAPWCLSVGVYGPHYAFDVFQGLFRREICSSFEAKSWRKRRREVTGTFMGS